MQWSPKLNTKHSRYVFDYEIAYLYQTPTLTLTKESDSYCKPLKNTKIFKDKIVQYFNNLWRCFRYVYGKEFFNNILIRNFTFYYTGEPSSQRSVAYEKACILFNLAAIYTQIGARHDRKSEKGLDGAVYSFLQAAGVFKHIYDTFTNAPSMDLKPLVSCFCFTGWTSSEINAIYSQKVLDVFVDLMLAQSRECLYEKLQLQIEIMSIQDADTVRNC